MPEVPLIITDGGVQLGPNGKGYGLDMLPLLLEGDNLPWRVVDLRGTTPDE